MIMKRDNIIGWPGYYISKRGNLYTSKFKNGWYRCRPHIHHGRYTFKLKNKGKTLQTGISRLVALAWVPNPKPEEYNVVMHLDNNPLNNHYTNLKWGTQKMNMQQAISDKRNYHIIKGEDNLNRKISNKDATRIRIEYRKASAKIINELASKYGISTGYVRKVLQYKNK